MPVTGNSGGKSIRQILLLAMASVTVGSLPIASSKIAADDAEKSPAPIVLISIDGLKPDYILEADKLSLKVPNLRRLVAEGMTAAGVRGVMPTVTYPAHTTMVTGVSATKHGILTNTPFDPLARNMGGWYWYAEDIRVPTLWDLAAKAGITTSSVDWPVTVGANIKYNIAQYWRASTPDDHKIIRAVSSPGLLAEAERVLGPYPEGNDYTVAADRRRTAFNVYVLETRKARFHLCYFSGLDTEEHRSGPYSVPTMAALEQIDEMVGDIRVAAEKVGGGQATICVVSDHGFSRTDREIHLNAAFVEAGLIKLNELGRATSWRAFAWYPSGSAGVYLENANDVEARDTVRQVLDRLAAEHPDAAMRVAEPPDSEKFEGFPGASFVVSIQPPFRFGSSLRGPVVIAPARVAGTHGYPPDQPEMDAAFFIVGPGIPAGRRLGQIDMRDIAPTLADLLGLQIPNVEGRSVLTPRKVEAAGSQ
jgi:predicted AlkP superfamily pyrophosphatase or phosphodiesterase